MTLPRVAIRTLLCGVTLALLTPIASAAADAREPAPVEAAQVEPDEAVKPTARSVAEARRALTGARGEATRLRAALARKRQQLEAALDAKPQYREAVAQRNRAKAAYEAARRPALAAARGTQTHRLARERLAGATRALTSAKQGARLGAGEAIRAMTADVRQAPAALVALEAEEEANHPQAAAARAALDEAAAKVEALREQHVDLALAADPACAGLRRGLASAEARVDAAGSELKRLQKALAEWEHEDPAADDSLASAAGLGPGLLGARSTTLPLRGRSGTWTKVSNGGRAREPFCIGDA